MTAREMMELIGKSGLLRTYQEGLGVPVTIKDARTSYGNRQVLVEPKGGHGTAWVELARVTLDEEES